MYNVTKVEDLLQGKHQIFYSLAWELKTEQAGSSLELLLRFILYRTINSCAESLDFPVAV